MKQRFPNLYLALSPVLSLPTVLGIGVESPATAKPRNAQCAIVEVTCHGDTTSIRAEIPLNEAKGTGQGGGSSFYEGAKAYSAYDHVVFLKDVRGNHLTVNVQASFRLIELGGKVIVDNSVSTDIKVVRGKTNEYHFDKGITVKAYFAECKVGPKEQA
jgi:hypothetical protein